MHGSPARPSARLAALCLLGLALTGTERQAPAQCLVTTAPAVFDPSPGAWYAARLNPSLGPLPTSIALSDGPLGKRLVTRWNLGFVAYSLADPARPGFAILKDMLAEGYPQSGDTFDLTGEVASSADGTRLVVPWTDNAGYGTVVELASAGSYTTAGDYAGHVALMAPNQTAVLNYGGRYLGFTLATGTLIVSDVTAVRGKSSPGAPGSIPSERVANVKPRRFGRMIAVQGTDRSYLVINAQTEVIVVDVTNPGPAGSLASSFVATSFPPGDFYPAGVTAPSTLSTVVAGIHPVDHSLYVAVEGGTTTSAGIALARFVEATSTLTRRGYFLPQAPTNVLTSAAVMVPWEDDLVSFFVSGGGTAKKLRAFTTTAFSQDLAPANALLPLAMPTGVLAALRGAGTKAYLYSGNSNEAWAGAVDCTLPGTGAIPSISVEKVPKSGSPITLASGTPLFVGDELEIHPLHAPASTLTSWGLDADLHPATERSATSPFLSWPDLSGGGSSAPPTALKMVGPCDPRGPGGQPLEPVPAEWSWCWTSATTNGAQGGPDFGVADPAGTEKSTQVGFEVANAENGTNGTEASALATFDLRWRIPAVRAKAESILAGDVLADGSEGSPATTGWEWYFAAAPGGGVLAKDDACTGPTCAHVFPANGAYAYHLKVPYRNGYSSPDCGKDASLACTTPPTGQAAFRTITLADVALDFTVPPLVYRSAGAIPVQSRSRKGAVNGTFSYQVCQSPCGGNPPGPEAVSSITGDPFSVATPGSLSLAMPGADGTHRLRIGYTYTGTATCTTGSPCTAWWPSSSGDTATWASVTVSPVEAAIVLAGPVTKFGSSYQIYLGDTGTAWAYAGDGADPNPPAGLLWTFGNGQTSTAQGASFSYSAVGTYTMTLDGYGTRQSVWITAVPRPAGQTAPAVTAVTFSRATPAVGELVTVSCAATPGTFAIGSYQLSFGDGQRATGTGSTATHAWASEGTKTVTCTALDVYGFASLPGSAPLDVGGPFVGPTVTSISVTPEFPQAGAPATLTCLASPPAGRLVAGYGFDFGDGTAPVDVPSGTVTHVYAAEGTWLATCRATDDSGRSGFLQRNVVVYAPSYALTVGKIGLGSGLVTSTPSGLSCGTVCSASFAAGSTVTLTALPSPGSRFAGWSGEGCSGVDPCSVHVAGPSRVTANFLPEAGALYVPVTPCRVADTRTGTGVPLAAGEVRLFDVVGSGCSVPANAQAVSLNVTATQPAAPGFVTVLPGGAETPGTQVVAFSAGATRAAPVIIQLGVGGAVAAYNGSPGTVHVILDVNGAFQ